jgi:predicted FMN-binding regulatory protein PaiB
MGGRCSLQSPPVPRRQRTFRVCSIETTISGAKASSSSVGHTTRVDPVSRQLISRGEVLLVFQGPNGYVSPAWYGEGAFVSTWNFTTVHVSGVPELLEGQEAFSVLARTVEHFEAARDDPWTLQGSSLEYAHRIAAGTVPFRLRSVTVRAKAKLSQDKPREIQERVVAALEEPGPYANAHCTAAAPALTTTAAATTRGRTARRSRRGPATAKATGTQPTMMPTLPASASRTAAIRKALKPASPVAARASRRTV